MPSIANGRTPLPPIHNRKRRQRSKRAVLSKRSPVVVRQGKQLPQTITRDEQPRPATTPEQLAQLRPAFRVENGTVTAGNASALNDGAAAVF